jgi:hypothetical protein
VACAATVADATVKDIAADGIVDDGIAGDAYDKLIANDACDKAIAATDDDGITDDAVGSGDITYDTADNDGVTVNDDITADVIDNDDSDNININGGINDGIDACAVCNTDSVIICGD